MPLKLGSNWKSCGPIYDMRRFMHGNTRLNFGFCKGDDNFGGRKRKELDDFLKSLGKQMNLVMYRMEDTERLRSRMRERRRREVFEKAEKEEEREKAVFARLERNRRWRARREDSGAGKKDDDEEGGEEEEGEKDAKEKRKRKNKEWRERRSASNSQVDLTNASAPVPPLSSLLLTELTCPFCQEDMAPPGEIWQCREGHSLCQKCRARPDMQTCPGCMGKFMGRNKALEQVAALVFPQVGVAEGVEYTSRSFTYHHASLAQVVEAAVMSAKASPVMEEVKEEEEVTEDSFPYTEGETLKL